LRLLDIYRYAANGGVEVQRKYCASVDDLRR
jgi:hypothetical protein